METVLAAPLVAGLVLPLCRLVAVMAVGLVIAQALETFGWTAYIARLAAPLVRLAHLSPASGAAFSLSFASPSAANAILAEGLAGGGLSRKELVIANVINSTPAFLVHLPSLLAMAYSFLGAHAFAYVGLVFAAAAVRTWGAVLAGRFLLDPPAVGNGATPAASRQGTLQSMIARFRKRLAKVCLFTIPVYCVIFILQKGGLFTAVESFLAAHAGALFFLHPASLGVVVLFVAAESSAAFAAAAALLHGGTLLPEQAVTALLIGNILSSPMRAFRHQLPSYAGFYSPATALLLVGVNQSLRAATLVLAVAAYSFWAI
ncbi:putative membrane protein [uncultured delta proteobacterium]|uniref:Putative membrane protein n=1 Tax=uncultured delta proteobacterium TaxID=34034 RepID=A0A212K0H9_9DELT|nr:putative membrane protein [uncultured delta proteobacterium]